MLAFPLGRLPPSRSDTLRRKEGRTEHIPGEKHVAHSGAEPCGAYESTSPYALCGPSVGDLCWYEPPCYLSTFVATKRTSTKKSNAANHQQHGRVLLNERAAKKSSLSVGRSLFLQDNDHTKKPLPIKAAHQMRALPTPPCISSITFTNCWLRGKVLPGVLHENAAGKKKRSIQR